MGGTPRGRPGAKHPLRETISTETVGNLGIHSELHNKLPFMQLQPKFTISWNCPFSHGTLHFSGIATLKPSRSPGHDFPAVPGNAENPEHFRSGGKSHNFTEYRRNVHKLPENHVKIDLHPDPKPVLLVCQNPKTVLQTGPSAPEGQKSHSNRRAGPSLRERLADLSSVRKLRKRNKNHTECTEPTHKNTPTPAGFPLPGPAGNGSSRRPPWGNKGIRSGRWEDILVHLRGCQSGSPCSLFPGAG